MRGARVTFALLMAILALPALADGRQTAQINAFIIYARSWCEAGNERGCTIMQELLPMSATLAESAADCADGDIDACLTARSIRRYFYVTYTRLPLAPDMVTGPDGSPPTRPIWDQPDPGPWFPANCSAFLPECGYFGDPTNPGSFW